MHFWRRVPIWIAFLLLLDVAIVAAAVMNFLLGAPFARLTLLLHLDREISLQAWYSSMQWLCAGVLFGALALHLARSRPVGLAALFGFSLLCIVFSIDEITGVHEWLGQKSDALLPGGERAATPLWRTGVWPLLIGIPVIVLLALLTMRLRYIFQSRAPRARRMLIIGLVVMFTGALAVELGANLVEIRPGNEGLILLQLVIEELMEMLGVTCIVWSGYELLRSYGFSVHAPKPTPAFAPGASVDGRATAAASRGLMAG